MNKLNSWIHLSVDDVIDCFSRIYKLEPQSIFDDPFLGFLKSCHERYGINCDLYVFEEDEEFHISLLQARYWKELRENKHWLKFGWHRRTNGELKDDLDGDMNSCNRVFNLIKTKIGTDGWSKSIRLHRWNATTELLGYLCELGCEEFLTADSDCRSYDLNLEEEKELKEFRVVKREKWKYIKTDIRLDKLGRGKSILSVLLECKLILESTPENVVIEMFFHERNFSEIQKSLEQLWNEYSNCIQPLFISASTVKGNEIYFTTFNTLYLFCYNMITETCKIITKLPGDAFRHLKHSDMFWYKSDLWIIPHTENFILIYNASSAEVRVLKIPYDISIDVQYKYRKGICVEDSVFLLPSNNEFIVKINLDSKQFTYYKGWPVGVAFDKRKRMNFVNMSLDGGKLYLVRDGCSRSICMDIKSGEMEEWNIDIHDTSGIVYKKNLYVLPMTPSDNIQVIDIDTGVIAFEEKPPEWIWNYNSIYHSYRYAKVIKDYMYFFPEDANALIVIDTTTKKVQYVDTRMEGYLTTYNSNAFRGYNLLKNGKNKWLISLQGNMWINLNDNHQVIGHMSFFYPIIY